MMFARKNPPLASSIIGQESSSGSSRPELLPYVPAHVLAGKAKAKPAAKPPELSSLLVSNFASGSSSGAKVPCYNNIFLVYKNCTRVAFDQKVSIFFIGPDTCNRCIYHSLKHPVEVELENKIVP